MSIPYRLGLDIGTNTIGWAALRLDDQEPDGLMDGGVIVFPDGREDRKKETLATSRRGFRSQRKRIRAKRWRRDQLRQFFITTGLISADHNFSARSDNDPYRPWRLRSEGLSRKLAPVELVDALLHLHNRRGFKSNRLSLKQEAEENKQSGDGSKKAADKKDNQKKTWEQKEQDVKLLMAGANCATFGAYIFYRLTQDKEETAKRPDKFTLAVRFRKDVTTAPPPATRTLIAQELTALRHAQMEKGGSLSAAQWDQVTALILDQRPLRTPDVGLCTFEFAAQERRAPRALPSSIRFRIQQTLCHLRKQDKRAPLAEATPLTAAEFDAGLNYLLRTGAPSAGGLRKAMKLPAGIIFREEIKDGAWFKKQGDPVGPKLAAENLYGEAWYDFDLAQQDHIVKRLRDLDDKPEEIESLSAISLERGGFGLTAAAAPALVKIAWSLPEGHGDLSTKAIMKILPHLTVGETYASACTKAGYDHSFARKEIRLLKRLPYYGAILRGSTMNGTHDAGDTVEKRYGRVANVTVHVALNQLRKLMNDLIHTHGAPQQIVIETTRHLAKGAKDRYALMRQQEKNEKNNERLNADIAAAGAKPSYENRRRWRLWEEQDHRCFYSGTVIAATQVCSSFCDIDHIIPRARGGFDALDNQVLCLADINRDKRDRTPYEAFVGGENKSVDWESFEKRLIEWKVPESKKWKCGPNAAEIARDDGEGWLPRQLTDTAYAARLAHRYLQHVCPQVWTTKGRLTASLRHTWDLTKDRDYLSNHFIDAVVIALTDRKRVKFYNDLGRKYGVMDGKDIARDRKLKGEPWPGFHDQVMDHAEKLIPSWRPDHEASGQLHQATLYSGWIQDGAGWRRLILKPGQDVEGDPLIKLSSREATSTLFPELKGKKKSVSATDEPVSTNVSSEESDGADNEKKKTPEAIVRDYMDSFVDAGFRHRFMQEVEQRRKTGMDLLTACRDYIKSRNIRAIECFTSNKGVPLSSLRRVIRGTGANAHQAFVLTGNNFCVDIYQVGDDWHESITTVFDAVHQSSKNATANPEKRLMRLHKGDAIEIDTERGREIWFIRKLAQGGRIFLWPIWLSSHASKEACAPYKGLSCKNGWAVRGGASLLKKKATPIRISIIGRPLSLSRIEPKL